MIVYLSGVSGTGKTTLGNNLVENLRKKLYDSEFISFSGKVLWEAYGIKNHADLIQKGKLQPNWLYEYQLALLNQRKNVLSSLKPDVIYVTDRSPIDNLVYTISELSDVLPKELLDDYIYKCQEVLNMHPYVLGLHNFNPGISITDDSFRIVSPFYQVMIDAIFKLVVWEYNLLNVCKGCVVKLEHGEYDTNLYKMLNATYSEFIKRY